MVGGYIKDIILLHVDVEDVAQQYRDIWILLWLRGDIDGYFMS